MTGKVEGCTTASAPALISYYHCTHHDTEKAQTACYMRQDASIFIHNFLKTEKIGKFLSILTKINRRSFDVDKI